MVCELARPIFKEMDPSKRYPPSFTSQSASPDPMALEVMWEDNLSVSLNIPLTSSRTAFQERHNVYITAVCALESLKQTELSVGSPNLRNDALVDHSLPETFSL